LKSLNINIGMKPKLLSIITIILLTQSCSKDNNDSLPVENTYYYLTAAQLNQTPYFTNPDFDTISFASDKGDTLTFVKTKTDTSWYKENGLGSPDCGYDQNFYQTLHNNYATIKGIGSFDVKHWKQNIGSDINFIDFEINNVLFHIYESTIIDTKASNYIAQLTLNNKIYTDCHYFTLNNLKIHLNKNFGIFFIEDLSSNIKYQLIN
jgi:hypothetical protein